MGMTSGSGQVSTGKAARIIIAIVGILMISMFYYLWALRELAAEYFFYAVILIVVVTSSLFAWLSKKK